LAESDDEVESEVDEEDCEYRYADSDYIEDYFVEDLHSIAASFDYEGVANKRMRRTYTIKMKQNAIAYVLHHANVLGMSMHAAYDRFQTQVVKLRSLTFVTLICHTNLEHITFLNF